MCAHLLLENRGTKHVVRLGFVCGGRALNCFACVDSCFCSFRLIVHVCACLTPPPLTAPQVLGGDLAGYVEEADERSHFKKNDAVAALTPGFWTGSDSQDGGYR